MLPVCFHASSLEGGDWIFKIHNDLVHAVQGEAGTDESAQVLTQKNQKTVHAVVSWS